MSERGQFRGSNRGRGRGRGGGEGEQSSRGGHSSGQSTQHEKPKKENILDLSKHVDKQINVKFSGGREVIGTLKGHDQLLNLVLDDVQEVLHDEDGETATRPLGLVVARGTLLTSISPLDGREIIENPFAAEEEPE